MTAAMTVTMVPVNANEWLEKAGIRMKWTPGNAYTQSVCDKCACGTWMGPDCKRIYEANPGIVRKLCMPCAIAEHTDAAVISLGNPDDGKLTAY